MVIRNLRPDHHIQAPHVGALRKALPDEIMQFGYILEHNFCCSPGCIFCSAKQAQCTGIGNDHRTSGVESNDAFIQRFQDNLASVGRMDGHVKSLGLRWALKT